MSDIDLRKPGAELLPHDPRDDEVVILPARPVVVRPAAEVEPAPLKPRQSVVGTIVRRPAAMVATLRESERTKRTVAVVGPPVRTVARVVWATGQGYKSGVKRAHDAASHGAYREQVRLARLQLDPKRVDEALDRLKDAKRVRSLLLKELPGILFGLVKVVAGTVLLLLGLLFVLGVAIQFTPGGWGWSDWWSAVGAVVETCGNVLYALTVLVVWAAAPLSLVLAYAEGRKAAAPPRWARTTADADLDIVIDERTVTQALDALRIPQIREHLKGGLPLQYIQGCRTDGRGTYCKIRLPKGVPAEEIARPARRAKLATGLYRATKETWPTVGDEAGILELWIADKGALTDGAGAYPLLTEGAADFFKGFPAGKNLRGDTRVIPMAGRNTIVGGMPDQGKSSAARDIMAGAALDPTVELRIWVPDSNFDFESFRPRCSRYVMGAEVDKIELIRDDLRELYREIQSRGDLLVKYQIPEVTREWASRGVGLHPVVCLLEEAHIAMNHKVYGEEISELVVEIVRLDRKRAIHFIVSTQAPTAKSIPRDVTRNCTNGIAFAVGDHIANDALLGAGSYAGGNRATELIPGTDKGTAMVKGFSGQRGELIQWHYINPSHENDQVSPLILRSLDAIARAGRTVPGTGTRPLEVERDLLEDLDAVLGDDPTRAADVPALLAAFVPGWVPYKTMTGKSLREILRRDYGIKVASTGNRWPVDPVLVRLELGRRSTSDLDAAEGPDGD